MSLLGLIITLMILGVLMWVVPMDPKMKNLLYAVVVIVIFLCLLQLFGVLGSLDRPIVGVR